MSFRLPDHWIWDFWFAQDGDEVHLFFLHAPRSLGDPDLRHRSARIGHAVSRDLRTWQRLPMALEPGPPRAFDDQAMWTGSVLRRGRRWHLFYTGISSRDNGAVQRIGHAISDDLVDWERHGLVLEADPQWYETLGPGVAAEAWRDPWVFRASDCGGFHMFVTARANQGPADGRGVIAHAVSADLNTWEVGPPVFEAGEFSTLEVPQLVNLGGRWRLLFSASGRDHSAARLARPGVVAQAGTHYLVADHELGPFQLDRDAFLVGSADLRFYAGRVIHHRGAWWFLAWQNAADRRFLGELSDPMPVTVGPGGSLSVATPPTPQTGITVADTRSP
jgi:beta-fructofuranosidase